jgi:hypothetical protein
MAVLNRSAEMLIASIKEWVYQKPTAITGCWVSYHGLEEVEYEHLTVGQ